MLSILCLLAFQGPITIDMIDVGTGLSLFVEGPDFAVMYDAGSNDDAEGGKDDRVIAFLETYHPDLKVIHHGILSHPHKDHLEMYDELLAYYELKEIWDSGAINSTCGYAKYISAVQKEGAILHSSRPQGSKVMVDGCGDDPDFEVTYGPQIEFGKEIKLGANASMTVLHARYDQTNLNENSVVVRMDLNGHRVIFMGDAQGGQRAEWANGTPDEGTAEAELLKCCENEMKADIMVVGHHGSRTSSRVATLNAIDAKLFLVSSGPKLYGHVVLPDQIVIDELERRGKVYRTDVNDTACATMSPKIGHAGHPGGCTNIRITLNQGKDPEVATLSIP